jgi:hypothetical protein
MLLSAVALFLAPGCASVIDDYEAERTLALSDPSAIPDPWIADATIQMSAALLDELMHQALTPPPVFDGELGVSFATIKPALTVETFKLGPASGCDECLSIELGLGGTVGWVAPLVGASSASVKVRGRIDAALSVEPVENGFALGIAPRNIHDVGIEVLGQRGGIDIGGPVVSWVESAVLSRFPNIPITEVGSETAPVREIRVSSSGKALRVDLLTGARMPGQLPAVLPSPVEGFQVDVSTSSLLEIARTEAFRAGAVAHGVVGEPTKLEFEGDHFAIGLRLWRPVGRGWWRDYEIEGTWAIKDGELTLAPTQVHDNGHSRGAAIADPLVAMGEGILQKALGNALNTTVPTRSGQLGTLQSELVVNKAEAASGMLRIHGKLEKLPPNLFYGGGK